jgi:hypothetical protein
MYNELKDIPPLTQIVVIILGVWGAIMNFTQRKLICNSIARRMGVFVIDIVASAGITMISFLSLTGYGFNEVLAVGVSGLFGHMGTRFISLAILVVLEKLGANKTYEYLKGEEK